MNIVTKSIRVMYARLNYSKQRPTAEDTEALKLIIWGI